MRVQFPDAGDQPLDPEWFRPLLILVPTIPALGSFAAFDPADFACMGRVLRHPRPDITLYKHRYTRRYLNLDAAGRAYRYVGPPLESFRAGDYRRQDLASALRALALGELAQLKAVPVPVGAGTGRRRSREDGGRGHLRLV